MVLSGSTDGLCFRILLYSRNGTVPLKIASIFFGVPFQVRTVRLIQRPSPEVLVFKGFRLFLPKSRPYLKVFDQLSNLPSPACGAPLPVFFAPRIHRFFRLHRLTKKACELKNRFTIATIPLRRRCIN